MARLPDPFSRAAIVTTPVILAFAISMLVIRLAGGDPWDAMAALLQGAFGGRVQVARTLSFLLPLTLVGVGWIVAFTTRRINIGFEGQIIVGGISAAYIGLHLGPFPSPFHLALGSLVGLVAGAGYAGIAAWLWARRDVNEIISTLLLNFVAFEILSWLVRGPLQEEGVVFPRSPEMLVSAQWPNVVPNTALTWDVLLVPVVIAVVWFGLRSTVFGFQMRVTGANPRLARHIGLGTKRLSVLAMLGSGALAGLAGASLVLGGETARLADGFSANFGFEGIVVALVARNSTWGCLPAALLFAALRSGGGLMETRVGVPLELVLVTQGVVILLVSSASILLDALQARRVEAVREQVG